jgi:major membrane immunogen (membrane-anchored lipoprotein)
MKNLINQSALIVVLLLLVGCSNSKPREFVRTSSEGLIKWGTVTYGSMRISYYTNDEESRKKF